MQGEQPAANSPSSTVMSASSDQTANQNSAPVVATNINATQETPTSTSYNWSSLLAPLTPPAQMCDISLKASYESRRDMDVAGENVRHGNWTTTAPYGSSYYANAKDQEDSRHVTALEAIETN